MIEFISVEDDNPALAHSPMVRAIEMMFAHIVEQGPIGLTPSKAFKRVFVHWAAAILTGPGIPKRNCSLGSVRLNLLEAGRANL